MGLFLYLRRRCRSMERVCAGRLTTWGYWRVKAMSRSTSTIPFTARTGSSFERSVRLKPCPKCPHLQMSTYAKCFYVVLIAVGIPRSPHKCTRTKLLDGSQGLV